MKMTRARLMAASVATLAVVAGSISPAVAKCAKKNPLFGFTYYTNDKNCPSAMAKPAKPKAAPKVVKKASLSKNTMAKTKQTARPVHKRPAGDPAVRDMQIKLAKAGYNPGSADGLNGPATARALDNFRKSLGLPSSTSHGNLMLALDRAAASGAASHSAAPKTAQKLPPADPGVKKMQVLLKKAGYNPGPTDGVKRPATVTALNKFRETLGLPSSTSHGNLMLALNRAAGS